MEAFTLAAGVILLAELGDKSQLIALALAARHGPLPVLAGVALAAALLSGGSVLVGSVFALALPTTAINIAAGIVFLLVAAWTIRGEDEEAGDEAEVAASTRWAILTVAGTFVLAELGDKTMLATITLATTGEPVATWLGATAGMVGADVVAIAAGTLLGSRLPERAIRLFSAAAFVVFGLLLVGEGLGVV